MPAQPRRDSGGPEEIELKFEVLERTAPARLFEPGHRALAHFEPDDDVRVRSVQDIYLDTAFGRLAAAGLAARIRSEMGRHVVAVKSVTVPVVGAAHRRLEVEGPAVPTLVPDTWPVSDARILVQAAIGGEALTVIARLRQQRRSLRLRRGETIVELSLDDMEALGPPGDDTPRATRTELEAELLAGEVDYLAALGAALGELPGLAAAVGSKLEWARSHYSA